LPSGREEEGGAFGVGGRGGVEVDDGNAEGEEAEGEPLERGEAFGEDGGADEGGGEDARLVCGRRVSLSVSFTDDRSQETW
jgi:hypothetical protein